ncbi:putative cucumisin [Helianthus annuus]|nr:putative cucumisin [Helianthus annuus]
MASSILVLILTTILTFTLANAAELETYIVHLDTPIGQHFFKKQDRENWYHAYLPQTTSGANEEPATIVFAYHNVLNGFAAKLSAEHVKAMESMEGFLFARPQRMYSTQTTHTPNFLGLHQNKGFWRGCNNKLIGLRDLTTGGKDTWFDENGHGTHTSSTAAGNFVNNASVSGNAKGTAAGIVPLAHVAVYKVCTDVKCSESAIIAGLDAAVEDGVDVLSLSLGIDSVPLYQDGIAIGAFTAIQKGIFVACAAGNSGPSNSTLSNEAPWILTVGASTIDRKIVASVSLGNKDVLDGQSLFQPKAFPQTYLPLVYVMGKNAKPGHKR